MRNKINILIIRFGSIGRRHAEILSNQKFTKLRRHIPYASSKLIEDILDFDV